MAAMVAGPFPALTSAGGVIALLDEPAADLQTRALERLNDMVHEFWPEISGSIGKIEQLFEDEGFQSQKLAALVASKVFYHLGSMTMRSHLHWVLVTCLMWLKSLNMSTL